MSGDVAADGSMLAPEIFRLAIEASPSSMVFVNGDGAIVLINGEVERLFGYRPRRIARPAGRNSAARGIARQACRLPLWICQASRRPPFGYRARFPRAAQGRQRFPDRGRAQPVADRRRGYGALRHRRYQRTQAARAIARRIRDHGEPRAAHANDVDRRFAWPHDWRCGRRAVSCGRASHRNCACELPTAGPAGQRHPRHQETGIRASGFPFSTLPAVRAGGAGDRRQSWICRRLRRAHSAGRRDGSFSTSKSTPIALSRSSPTCSRTR